MMMRTGGATIAVWLAFFVLPPAHGSDDVAADFFATLPAAVGECTAERTADIKSAAERLETQAAQWVLSLPDTATPQDVLARLTLLLRTKNRLDRENARVLAFRQAFASLPPGPERRETIRQYLVITSKLIDLSGRIRYLLRDGIEDATYFIEEQPGKMAELLDVLIETKSSIGASVVSYLLFDPDPSEGGQPASAAIKNRVIQLIAVAPAFYLLQDLADFIMEPTTTALQKLAAAQAILEIGLPQNRPPGGDDSIPAPAITARQLREIISRIDATTLPPNQASYRQDLLAWLKQRAEKGALGNELRVNGIDVQPGDWFLMRNPSPYNLFMDLSPGLFTHVGVVATQTGPDGVRRFVIVEMPERKAHIPATNVGAYLGMTLHYVFLRHQNPAVGRKMGQVARDLIGNETQFDLTFRTERVLKLKGQELKGRRINTYCAGFLLVCAQETGLPREAFFPIPEYPAGGNCLENLAKLGIGIGHDMISPTGALFSQQMNLIGGRTPMYEPGREIKEAVYDHFAQSMILRILTPTPNAMQALREKLAALAKYNSLLAKALAKANDVSEHMDLESAAKAFTVVGALDEIADANAREFFLARRAITCGPFE